MLSIVLGKSDKDVRSDLWDAVRLELVEDLEGSYKFIHDPCPGGRLFAHTGTVAHRSAPAHRKAARAHIPAERREESVFEIVNQLNRGADLIASRDERERLAEFNLLAGQRAKASAAYASALTYLTAGAALLPEDSWERRHELTFALELHQAECEFLTVALRKRSSAWRRCRPAPQTRWNEPRSRACAWICTRPSIRAAAPLRRARLSAASGHRLVAASDE